MVEWTKNILMKSNMKTICIIEDDDQFIVKEKKWIEEMIGRCTLIFEPREADLYLIDIEGDIDGIALANDLRKIDPTAFIVFISSHSELIFDALKTMPYYFARKDHEEDIRYIFRKIKERWEEKTLILENIKVPFVQIYYIERQGSYLNITTQVHTYKKRMSLTHILEDLDNTFVLVNKSEIINVNHVKDIKNEALIMVDDHMIYMSRSKKKAVTTYILAMREGIL